MLQVPHSLLVPLQVPLQALQVPQGLLGLQEVREVLGAQATEMLCQGQCAPVAAAAAVVAVAAVVVVAVVVQTS